MLAFRLAGQHLDRRLPVDGLTEVAGACGIGDSPPASAVASLAARLDAVRPGTFDQELVVARSLLRTWSLRGSPLVFPSAQAHAFTRELEPPDAESLRAFLPGASALLEMVGLSAPGLADAVSEAASSVLDGRVIVGKCALDAAVARAVRPALTATQRAAWEEPSGFAVGQTAGEALASFALRVAALRGVVCFAGRLGRQPSFARTDQWLGEQASEAGVPSGPGLVRRYLNCYGPSTHGHFASWAGIGEGHARGLWDRQADSLVEVAVDGRRAYVHADDLPRLLASGNPRTLRLLPPLDPWVQLRDRTSVLPDRRLHPRVWRTIGWPGTLLLDGRIAGIWRSRPHGATLRISVEPWADLGVSAALEAEAESLAVARGLTQAEVTLAPEPS